MRPLTVGIIGAGRIGKLHAENLMARVKGAKLKAVTDPFLDEKWAESKGIPAYLINSVKELNSEWMTDVSNIGITSGASTPDALVQ